MLQGSKRFPLPWSLCLASQTFVCWQRQTSRQSSGVGLLLQDIFSHIWSHQNAKNTPLPLCEQNLTLLPPLVSQRILSGNLQEDTINPFSPQVSVPLLGVQPIIPLSPSLKAISFSNPLIAGSWTIHRSS